MVGFGQGVINGLLPAFTRTVCTKCAYFEKLGVDGKRVHGICPKCGAATRRVV